MKDIEGKYDPTYLFRSAKIAIHYIREYGSKKYKNRGTWKLTDKQEYFKAAERHLDAMKEGEEFAKDSGLPHIWHALCDIMFYIEKEKTEMKEEERIKNVPKRNVKQELEKNKQEKEIKRRLFDVG